MTPSITAILHELVKDAPSGLPAKFIAERIARLQHVDVRTQPSA